MGSLAVGGEVAGAAASCACFSALQRFEEVGESVLGRERRRPVAEAWRQPLHGC